ncbi:hypothetical protein Tco_0935363 [Tanacetum coccineum]
MRDLMPCRVTLGSYKVIVPRTYIVTSEELATQKSNPPKPVTLFVRTRPAKSQISTCLQGLNSLIPAFAHVIHQRTDPCRYPSGSGEFKPVKAMFTEQIIPFYENVKQLVQKLNANIVTEVKASASGKDEHTETMQTQSTSQNVEM